MSEKNTIKEDVDRLIAENPGLITQLENKSFLVTGATGMIGRYVTNLLLEIAKNHNSNNVIIANARNETKAREAFADYQDMEQFKLLISDVNDIPEIDYPIDFILHAASPTQPQDFQERPVDIIQTNVYATNKLLDLAREKSAHFCLLSTLEVYGAVQSNAEGLASVTENDFGALDSLSLRSTYPESKRLAENLCVAYKQQYNTNSTIVRLAPTISPIIAADDKRVFAQFVHDVLANQDITVYSDAASKERSYTYIADAISGILTALVRSDNDNFVFNLANNNNIVSIKTLAETILTGVPESTSTLNIVERAADQNTSTSTGLIQLNSQKLLNLGWNPTYSIDESIQRIVSNNK